MEVIATSKVPSNREIEALEKRVAELKAKREDARKTFLMLLREGAVNDIINKDEAFSLIKVLQGKFQGARKRIRGMPVPKEVKHNLEEALRQGEYSLSQLEKMFGLSSSYIWRVKRDLGLTGIRNAYSDHQLHQHDQQQTA